MPSNMPVCPSLQLLLTLKSERTDIIQHVPTILKAVIRLDRRESLLFTIPSENIDSASREYTSLDPLNIITRYLSNLG